MADLQPLPDGADIQPEQLVPLFELPIHEEAPPAPLDDVDTLFNPAHREDFRGLLYLGVLEDRPIKVAGHTFTLATPSLLDKLARGPLHKEYVNTISAEAAWRVITVASWLKAIDGVQMPLPLNGKSVTLAERFAWLLDSIQSDAIVALIHQEIITLEDRVQTVIDEVQRLGKSFS